MILLKKRTENKLDNMNGINECIMIF